VTLDLLCFKCDQLRADEAGDIDLTLALHAIALELDTLLSSVVESTHQNFRSGNLLEALHDTEDGAIARFQVA
jgi:hypothetical protein